MKIRRTEEELKVRDDLGNEMVSIPVGKIGRFLQGVKKVVQPVIINSLNAVKDVTGKTYRKIPKDNE